MNMEVFTVDNNGKLLISTKAFLLKGISTPGSYRSMKSQGRLSEVEYNGSKWVLAESMTATTYRKAVEKLGQIQSEYTRLLVEMDAEGIDCTRTAVEFTASTFSINEPFIKSSIVKYINAHSGTYLPFYLESGISSDSVKGYAKQCALIQWIHDFIVDMRLREPYANIYKMLERAFRSNLLTVLSGMTFETKIPLSETRFNAWLDKVMEAMDKGKKPEEIITVKRLNNKNSKRFTDEQQQIAVYLYRNGNGMPVEQVYQRLLEMGRQKNWWLDKNGNSKPITIGRLYQILQPLKNPLTIVREDGVQHHLKVTPAVTRALPTKKNECWGIDGTAHNENVECNRKVRQYLYKITVYDYASLRLLGISTVKGGGEPFESVKAAVDMAIRTAGYKPMVLQCDKGPSYKELKAYCEEIGITLMPAKTGNARSKPIESLHNLLDNDVTRYLRGYNGQNLTARGQNSRVSDSYQKTGQVHARDYRFAAEWLKTEGMKLWNERVIDTLDHKPCGKTPYELWDSLESATSALTFVELCRICGTKHSKKLTNEGLEIQEKNVKYLYFPAVDTPEEREKAERIFRETPRFTPESSKLDIYVLEYGEPAAVFTRDGRYLGAWTIKKHVPFLATFNKDTETFNKMSDLQERTHEKAREIADTNKQYVEHHPDAELIHELATTPLVGKRRKYEGRYDKEVLLNQETAVKAGISPLCQAYDETPEYKEYVDPDTGEIHRVEKKKVI